MNLDKNTVLLVLIFTAIAITLSLVYYLSIAIPISSHEYEVIEYPVYLTVEESGELGFNVDATQGQINFGSVPRGATGARYILINNTKQYDARIVVTSGRGEVDKWMYTSVNDFIIPKNSSAQIKVYVHVPNDAEFGDYIGKLRITIEYKVSKASGFITGQVGVNVGEAEAGGGDEGGGGGGGGGGGSEAVPTLSCDGSESRFLLNLNDNVRFNFYGTSYIISVAEVSSTSVALLKPESTYTWLYIGEAAQSIDINRDTTPDVQVTLNSVSRGGKASITFKILCNERGSRVISIDYPSEINISLGETKTIPITIENRAGFIFEKFSLSVSGGPLKFDIEPKTAEKIYPKERKTFLLTTSAPVTQIKGEYTLLLKAAAKDVFVGKEIKLIISELEIPEKPEIDIGLKKEIENVQGSIAKIWEEAKWVQNRGKDVSEIFKILDVARTNANDAQKSWDSGKYFESRKYLDIARASLEKAVVELSKFSIVRLTNEKIIMLSFGAVLAAVLVFTAFYMRKYSRIMRAYKKIEKYKVEKKKEAQKEKKAKDEISKEKAKLSKQLELVKEGYRLGYISAEAYAKSRKKIEKMLEGLES